MFRIIKNIAVNQVTTAAMSDIITMCLTRRPEQACREIVDGFTSSILKSKPLPSKDSFTGTLATGIRSDPHTIAGEIIIWGDETTAKMTMHVRTPVTVYGPGPNDFTFPKQGAELFKNQYDLAKHGMEFIAGTLFPDKLIGKSGLKCKGSDTPTKKLAAMIADKNLEKPKCMAVEHKVTVMGEQDPSEDSPVPGQLTLKYPLEMEAKGKLAANGDTLDPADLPVCAAKTYLLENTLPLRRYKCFIGDQPVELTRILAESQMKPGGNAFGPFYGQVTAQNTYMYSAQYNRIIHRPWVDRITLFALPTRDGVNRDASDVNMNSMLHLYANSSKRAFHEMEAASDEDVL